MPRHVVIPDINMEDDGSFSSGGNYNGGIYHQKNAAGRSGGYPPRTFGTPGGASVASVSSPDPEVMSVKRDREREGRCGDCGVQTHAFCVDAQTKQQNKVPLTVDGEVHRGRCLFCHPLPKTHPGLSNIVFSSSRSLNTVSSHGNNSVHSAGGLLPLQATSSRLSALHQGNAIICPDTIDSRSVASTVTDSIVDEVLHNLEDSSADLLDVLTAMRRFPDERQVQARGLEKLWIQSYDEENSVAIGRIGGIPTILNAMTAFPQHSTMQQYGCEALQNLADNDYNRDVIVEHGGLNAIVNAMNRHVDVVGVQQCGCQALANMSSSPEHQLDVANAGGIHAIIFAAQQYRDEESVLRAAYQALRSLGYDPNRHRNANNGAIVADTAQQQGANQEGEKADDQEEEQNAEDAVVLDRHGFPINN